MSSLSEDSTMTRPLSPQRKCLIAMAMCVGLATFAGPALAADGAAEAASAEAEANTSELFEIGPEALITDSAVFAARLTAVHNDARKRFGSAPLKWDPDLAAEAGKYARILAKTGVFEHAAQRSHGENLWMGSAGYYSVEAMVAMWSEEAALFKPGRFPDIVARGGWMNVGHYTQMVWPTTTHVGCAVARNATDDYLVCRYSPPGNVMGTKLP
jgi:uncharacterized protein YkwD